MQNRFLVQWTILAAVLGFALGGSFVWSRYDAHSAREMNSSHSHGVWYSTFLEHTPDWFVAGFTLLLAYVTYRLVQSTNKLWDAGERQLELSRDTARRQLRAYTSVTPTAVYNFLHPTFTIVVACSIKNHGATPASRIYYDVRIDILSNPLPANSGYEGPAARVEFNGTLFPGSDVPMRFFFNRRISQEEIAAIESGSRKLHIWGVMHYVDAFDVSHTTKFVASAGGPGFVGSFRDVEAGTPPRAWFWDYGDGHNAVG